MQINFDFKFKSIIQSIFNNKTKNKILLLIDKNAN